MWTRELLVSFHKNFVGPWLGGVLVLGVHGIGISNPECGRDGFTISCGLI